MHYEGVPTPAEQQIPDGGNLLKIGVLFFLLFGAFVAADYGVTTIAATTANSDALWQELSKWGWLLLCGTLAGVAVQGLGILAHDAVHKVMLSHPRLNELIGGLISAFALIPFNANRQFHMLHHRYSHQRDADPEQPMHNHPLWFALTIGSVIALSLQYRILLTNLLRLSGASSRQVLGALKDVTYLTLSFGCYLYLLPTLGLPVEHTIVPLLLTLPLLFGMRAISDHYGLPAVVRNKKESEGAASKEPLLVQQEVSGWVILTNPLLEWLWSGVNYHEVHHKFPYLSHRYLKQTFAATQERLPYAVANGYLRNLWRQRDRNYYNTTLPVRDDGL